MSTTTTATTATTTCTGGPNTNRWILPVTDASCAVPATGNYTEIMNKCCFPALVTPYASDCGLYCLAQGQTVSSLIDCIRENGGRDGDFLCYGNMTATATATATATSTSSESDSETGSASPSPSGNSAGAAVVVGMSKSGLGLLVMMFCSAVLGLF